MDVYVALIISALVSLHQYIPSSAEGYNTYFNSVEQLTESDILFAANQSCRYLYDLSERAGIETLGEQSSLASAVSSLLANANGISVMLDLIDSPFVYSKLNEKGISPKKLRDLLTHLCAADFKPYLLPPALGQQVMQFIESEIAVLKPQQLRSFGDFGFFGAVEVFDSQERPLLQESSSEQEWVAYAEINPSVMLSLLATEDEQFFSHDGVSTRSVARILKEALTSDDASGGSTVTMQLLKNLFFLRGPRSSYKELNQGRSKAILRKVREWYWSKPFELQFRDDKDFSANKKKVAEMYLNLVNFGNGIQGIGQAARFYFGKSAADLTVPESAYLTSLLKRPGFYSDPSNYEQWTKPRRNDYVIGRIKKICENVKNQERLSGATIVLGLCKATRMDRAESADLAKLKANPLPSQFYKSTNEVEEEGLDQPSVTPFISAARRFTDRLLEVEPGYHKAIKVKTTVIPELQEVVSKIARTQLDAYDSARQAREYIRPAIDDRGKVADIRKEDLGISFLYNINRFTRNQWQSDHVLLYSVIIQHDRIKRQSLTEEEINQALATLDTLPPDLNPKALLSEIRNLSTQMGEVWFVSISQNEGVKVLSVEDVIATSDFSESLEQEFRTYYGAKQVRDRLLLSATARLNRSRPREEFEVLARMPNGNFLNSSLKTVQLSNADRSRAQKLSGGQLRFFWAQQQDRSDNQAATPAYRLETPRLQAAVLVVDSNTGKVLANFAGYSSQRSTFDRSLQMQRQVGSSLKPWAYFLALDNGLSLDHILQNSGVSFVHAKGTRVYRPRNYSSDSPQYVRLEDALVYSYNQATMSLLKNPAWDGDPLWPERLLQFKTLLESIGLYDEAEYFLPTMLGTQNTSLQRLVNSFTFFANGFQINNSYLIESIENEMGETLYKHSPTAINVMRKRASSLLDTQIALAGVANRGTAWPLKGLAAELKNGSLKAECFRGLPRAGEQSCFGGKTGTTNDSRDTWFTGFSKNFVIGVWVGYDEFRPIPGKTSGSRLAYPIFEKIVREGIDWLPPVESFIDPNQHQWQDPSFGGPQRSNQVLTPQTTEDALAPTELEVLSEISQSAEASFEAESNCSCVLHTNSSGLVTYIITNPEAPDFTEQPFATRGLCLDELEFRKNQGSLLCL